MSNGIQNLPKCVLNFAKYQIKPQNVSAYSDDLDIAAKFSQLCSHWYPVVTNSVIQAVFILNKSVYKLVFNTIFCLRPMAEEHSNYLLFLFWTLC